MTHYRLKGNLEHLRQYGQSAISTKNALRIVNNSFNLPIADMYRIKPDGTVIHAKKVFGHESVTVELPPMVEEPQPVEQRNVITPPVEWFIESFYLVYNVVTPAITSYPHYTGEHLSGYYIPPYFDLEFETRIKGSPGFKQFNGMVALSTDANAALTPTIERTFHHEPDPIKNYDQFETVDTFFRTKIYVGWYLEDGTTFHVIARSLDTVKTTELKIAGHPFKTYTVYTRAATGVNSWNYDTAIHVFGTTALPPERDGTNAEFEFGTVRGPSDDRDGAESEAELELFWGGAYDGETGAFVCLREEAEWSFDWKPKKGYVSFGLLGGYEDILIFEEYEEYYSIEAYPYDAKIYNDAAGFIVGLISWLEWDEFTDEYTFKYNAFKRDSEGNIQRFEKVLNLGSDIQAFYWHDLEDENGNSWPCNGTFRLVKESAAMSAQGDQFSFNPNDELQYDAQRLVVLPGSGY